MKEKHKQMKIGEIWEEAIGNYDGFIKLKIIELKNRTNTDNHSSRKSNMNKLVKFKKRKSRLYMYLWFNK